MIDKKPIISFEQKLYAAFTSGMMEFHQHAAALLALNQQELVNFMHAEGKKYVIERIKRKHNER